MNINKIKKALDNCLTIQLLSVDDVNLIKECLPGYVLEVVDTSTRSQECFLVRLTEVLDDEFDVLDDEDISCDVVDDYYSDNK